jgi:hypothetical protein
MKVNTTGVVNVGLLSKAIYNMRPVAASWATRMNWNLEGMKAV